jgi:SAM-dependent methyltransferase
MQMATTESLPNKVGRCSVCGQNRIQEHLRAPDRFHGRKQSYQLIRCPACSLVWLDNPPLPSEMGQHYGADYDRFIGDGGETSPERWRGRREILVKYKPSGALLDLGCSSGSFLASLRGQSWELHGVEISPAAAEKARARSGAQVFVGDILEAPFEPESFDVITSFDVLEHLYRPRDVMEKVSTWLKPDGIFYTLVPNIEAWEARLFRSYWYALELPRHLFHYTPGSLRYLAESVGLEEVLVATHSNSCFEYSARYICDDLLQAIRCSRTPLAVAKGPSLPFRVVRKAFRLALLQVFSRLAAMAEAGESIHAVFRKNAAGRVVSHPEENSGRITGAVPSRTRQVGLPRT